MAGNRRYRFIGAWAIVQILLGCLLVFVTTLVAFVVLSPWSPDFISRMPAESRAMLVSSVIAAIALAVILGGALVLSGQLLLLLRDINRHVARLDARDARRARDPGLSAQQRDATSRLLPRR
jgi:hypothetical protein